MGSGQPDSVVGSRAVSWKRFEPTDHPGHPGRPVEPMVRGQDLLGLEWQPAAEPELAAHPQPDRGRQRRARRDSCLQVPADRPLGLAGKAQRSRADPARSR
jgi:hypothetical protein